MADELTLKDLPPTDPRRLGKIVKQFADDYVMEGDEGIYQPTEAETLMLLDFGMGLVNEFIEQGAIAQTTESRIAALEEALRDGVEALELARCGSAPSMETIDRLHALLDNREG